ERVAEGEELGQLRAPRPLRRDAPRGEQPAPLAAVLAREADPVTGPRGAGDERALRAAPEIERDVPALRPDRAQEGDEGPHTARAREHEGAVDPGMPGDDWRRWRLDRPA